MGVSGILVEAGVVLLDLVVGQIKYVDAGVVFELVLASHEPHFVLLLDYL